jgi:hypothetical protein
LGAGRLTASLSHPFRKVREKDGARNLCGWSKVGESAFEVSHPCDKNKNAARVGHPVTLIEDGQFEK